MPINPDYLEKDVNEKKYLSAGYYGDVKHPGLNKTYTLPKEFETYDTETGQVKYGYWRETPMKAVGFDVETDPLTGQPKLIGFYNQGAYRCFTGKPDYLLRQLASKVMQTEKEGKVLACWSRFDGIAVLRLFLECMGIQPKAPRQIVGAAEKPARGDKTRVAEIDGNYVAVKSPNGEKLEYENDDDNLFAVYEVLPEDAVAKKIGKRWGKIAGNFHKKYKWIVEPVVKFRMSWSKEWNLEFGIQQVIHSNVQFYFAWNKKGTESIGDIRTVWMLDAKKHWLTNLENLASQQIVVRDKDGEIMTDEEGKEIKQAMLPWYSKLGKEFHVVDWNRYKNDEEFRKGVNFSNELDCRAASELFETMQGYFIEAFGKNPKSMLSAGTLTMFGLSCVLDQDSFNSINWHIQAKDWLDRGHDMNELKKLYCIAVESYSAGHIETYRIGYTPKVVTADLSSAYPGVIANCLLDLRGSETINGTGYKEMMKLWKQHMGRCYVFVRSDFRIPSYVKHTITIKDPHHETNNVRMCGRFRGSAMLEEVMFAMSQCKTDKEKKNFFDGEEKEMEWSIVICKGDESPLAETTKRLFQERLRYKNVLKSPAENAFKVVLNSMYGKTFEAIMDYKEGHDDMPEMDGYRAGQFWNPIIACIITAFTRVRICEAAVEVEKRGGRVVLIMTDALYWEGTEEMLPHESEFESIFGQMGWTGDYARNGWVKRPILDENREHKKDKDGNLMYDIKVLGMFEPPEVYDDFLCLSAGVYEYFKTKNGKRIIFQKTRGMAKGSSDENTDMVETDDESKSLRFALRQAIAEGKDYLEIEQKLVYSPGAMGVSGRPEYLGLIIDAVKKLKINAHTLYPKRFALPFTLQEVHDGLIETDAMEIDRFPEVKHGDQWSIPDGTLPLLREAFLKQTWGFMETEEYKEYRKSLKAPKGKDKEKIKGHQATYNTKRHGEQAEYLNYLKSKYGEDLKTLNSTFPLPGRSKWGARYLRSFIHPVTGEKGKAALEQFMQEEGYTS